MACGMLDEVVVSTSEESWNIVDHCKENGWKYWAGSESDLLSRHLGAAMTYDADAILRVTGDCIFHDPAILDRMVSEFSTMKSADALGNWFGGRTISEGLDGEIVTVKTMRALMQDRNCPREDWVSYLKLANRYNVAGWAYPEKLGHTIHLSIDTEDDLKRARRMMEILGNDEWRYLETLKAWEATR